MPEGLSPLILPPTPPELSQRARGFSEPLRGWMLGMVEWVTQIIRVLKDVWFKLGQKLNAIMASVTVLETAVTALTATVQAHITRAHDIFTFTVTGSLATGTNITGVKLVVRHAGVLLEAFAYVGTAPTGATLIIDVNRNGTTIFSSTKLQVAAGQQTGTQTGFSSAAVAVGDVLSIDVDQVGSTLPGSDLTVHLSVRP